MNVQQDNFLLTASKFNIPSAIQESAGIRIGEKLIKSVLLSTDLSYIQNLNADAVMIVNPFDKSNILDQAIIEFSRRPVFCDIGGGLLREEKTIKLATGAVEAGAAGVLITRPTQPKIINRIRYKIEGKILYTIMFDGEPVEELLDAGVDILNISTGEITSKSVFRIRDIQPHIPVMASGGPHDSTIRETIEAGANAIVFNPPTATEILRSIFDEYRNIGGR